MRARVPLTSVKMQFSSLFIKARSINELRGYQNESAIVTADI